MAIGTPVQIGTTTDATSPWEVTTGTPASTSAIIIWPHAGPQNSRVWIEDNRLDGPHASVALYLPRYPTTDIYVNRNRMIKGVYGEYVDSNIATEFNGNVDDVTGAPLSLGQLGVDSPVCEPGDLLMRQPDRRLRSPGGCHC